MAKEYTIIRNRTIGDLIQSVNYSCIQGWEPQGGAGYEPSSGGTWWQAMVKEVEDEKRLNQVEL